MLSVTPTFQGANLGAAISTTSVAAAPTGVVSFMVDGQSVSAPVPVGGLPGSGGFQSGFQFAQATAAFQDSTLSNGGHTLTANYLGDTNYSGSSQQLFFTLQPDFTLSASSPTITIPNPGGVGALNVSIGSLDGFTSSVNFACSGLPAETTCNFSPTTIKGSGSVAMTVITTPAKSSRLRYPPYFQWWTSGSAGIAGIFLLGIPARQRRWRRIVCLTVFALFCAALGCGGGNSSSAPLVQPDPGTAPGSYKATLIATSGSLVHQVGFQLVIR
jgi:hypothetical protein